MVPRQFLDLVPDIYVYIMTKTINKSFSHFTLAVFMCPEHPQGIVIKSQHLVTRVSKHFRLD